MLKKYFDTRGYETVSLREPMLCPVYGDISECRGSYGCSDLMLMPYALPFMNGIDLFVAQKQNGCRLSPRNKAVIAPSLPAGHWVSLAALGSAFFRIPLDPGRFEKWIRGCEKRMDLEQPLPAVRKENRRPCHEETLVYFREHERMHKAAAVNVSDCGICIKTKSSVLPNEIITIQTNALGIAEEGLVRWSREARDGTYLVGLSFCI